MLVKNIKIAFIIASLLAISSCKNIRTQFNEIANKTIFTKNKNKINENPQELQKNQSLSRKINFVEGTEDIPLMENFEKINEADFNFDSISGSVIYSSYKTTTSILKIEEFYEQNLSQMGWQIMAKNSNRIKFLRENQILEIEIYIKIDDYYSYELDFEQELIKNNFEIGGYKQIEKTKNHKKIVIFKLSATS